SASGVSSPDQVAGNRHDEAVGTLWLDRRERANDTKERGLGEILGFVVTKTTREESDEGRAERAEQCVHHGSRTALSVGYEPCDHLRRRPLGRVRHGGSFRDAR